MGDRVIDCCSLLNLFTGWGGLSELVEIPYTWHVCSAVLNESEYTREFLPNGAHQLIPLDLTPLIDAEVISILQPNTEEEMESYVRFASEIDDGEAQALSLAKHRGYLLLTDDRKASRVAARPEVGVRVISTVDVLKDWSQRNNGNAQRLPDVLRRISILARFRPTHGTKDEEWWRLNLP